MKLRSKILTYTLPLILIPFLLTAVAVYYFVIRANQVQIEEENKQRLGEVLVSIRQEIDSAQKDIKLLANVPTISAYLQKKSLDDVSQKNQAKSVLELFFKQNPYYFQLSLVDQQGLEKIKFSKLPQQQELQSLKNEAYFRRTLIVGSVKTPVLEFQKDKYGIVYTQSVYKEERFLGAIILTLNTKVFERSMRPLLQRDLRTFLFDDRGFILASAFTSQEEKNTINQPFLSNVANEILENSSFDANRKKTENGKFLLSFLPSESFPSVVRYEKQVGSNWFLGLLEPNETASVPFGFQIVFFSILFLAIASVLYLAAKASSYITIPLEKVSLATNKIARGETNLNLEIKTGDEVEDLAVAVKSMNFELQDYQKQLVQSAKLASMGEMTSEISHEIQNRISGISLWLQHLDTETEDEDPRQEYLDEMKEGLNGFMDMLGNLKEYYKTPVLDLQEIDLNTLVKDSLLFVQENIKQKKADIKLNLSNSNSELIADKEKLKSVIINLLLNAVDSLEEKGKVEISTETDEKSIILRISDNGKGIKEEDLSRIFYPFYSTKSGGSGLGLAISSNIISAHKGRIEVESEVGKGTTFKVLLPNNKLSTKRH